VGVHIPLELPLHVHVLFYLHLAVGGQVGGVGGLSDAGFAAARYLYRRRHLRIVIDFRGRLHREESTRLRIYPLIPTVLDLRHTEP